MGMICTFVGMEVVVAMVGQVIRGLILKLCYLLRIITRNKEAK